MAFSRWVLVPHATFAPYELAVEQGARSPEWDAFVATTPGGHHTQTSLWGQVKAVLGWDATRLILRRDKTIVGGVQLLSRGGGRVGKIAFAPRGPLLATHDELTLEVLLRAMDSVGREERIRYLKVQPPVDRHDLVPKLRASGWIPSTLEAAPTATVRVDVIPAEDVILARMRQSTRHKVRQSARKGMSVRVGGYEDFGVYWQIVEATARRQGFEPYPRRYYETMWRLFAEAGHARLLFAELDERVLSSTLLLGWGDTVTYKMGGWSGQRSSIRPNEAIHWAGMAWAKEAGYRWYDFDGIDHSIAVALKRDGTLPESARKGVANFKLGFGGSVELFPCALDRSPTALLRPAVRAIAPRMDRARSLAKRAIGRGR